MNVILPNWVRAYFTKEMLEECAPLTERSNPTLEKSCNYRLQSHSFL